MLKRLVRNFQLINGNIFAQLTGGILSAMAIRDVISTTTYAAAMDTDTSIANAFLIVPTNGVAFTLNVPLRAPGTGTAQLLSITIRNTTGGVLGAATFTAGAGGFRLGAAWTQPANGFSRSIFFRFDGTNWIEVGRTAADVAN